MDKLIQRFEDPSLWDRAAEKVEFDDYAIDGHYPTGFRITDSQPYTHILSVPCDVTDSQFLSFSVVSLYDSCPSITKESDATYEIKINDIPYLCPIPYNFGRIVIPVEVDEVEKVSIRHLRDGEDFFMVSDFRAWSPEMPSDLLYSVKRGLEREMLIRSTEVPVGEVSCRKGDRSVILEGWDFLERNVVLRFGAELHQVIQKVDNKVSFGSMYDGEEIKKNFTGLVYVVVPVEIGYYDREADLPGIALWYTSPRPQERHSLAEERIVAFSGSDIFIERGGATMLWSLTFEVAARSPQLVQMAAQCLRSYLGKSRAWVNGQKVWWQWKDPAIDSEPVEDYDIVPRSNYRIDVEVCEGVWEWVKVVGGKPRLKVYPRTR
jgi:hypothetical protein